MKHNKKFYRSQAAHKRLIKKHRQSKNEYKSFVYGSYHDSVFKAQEKQKRILSADEKKKHFRASEFFYFN